MALSLIVFLLYRITLKTKSKFISIIYRIVFVNSQCVRTPSNHKRVYIIVKYRKSDPHRIFNALPKKNKIK